MNPIRRFDPENTGPLTFNVARNLGRIIMYVPKEHVAAMGGWDGLKKLFHESFQTTSNPVWGEEQETVFAIELPNNAECIEVLNRLILERFPIKG